MYREVDVAVIGAGSAGLYALAQVRRAGKRFVLIDGGELGTTCARVGCMPSKALIQIAEDFHRRELLGRYGVEGGEALVIDTEDAMEHVRDLRDNFVDRVLSGSTDNLEDEFVQGYAEFLEPTLLKVGEDTIRASAVVVATGSRPLVPVAWEQFGDKVLTTDHLFEQARLPASLAVVGLGVIGLEMGQALSRVGVQVTGIDQTRTIARIEDPLVSKVAIEDLSREFPLWLGHPARIEAEGEQLRVTAGERSVVVDKVLASLGRVPNLDRLGLDRLGVEFDQRGLPSYDPGTMKLADLPIYLAGDVTGDNAILHEAGDDGRIAGYNAARGTATAFARKVHMAITFSDPNIANVGARWSELEPKGDEIAVGEVRFAPVGRALIMGKNRGALRVYAERRSGRLLGACMIAPKGENLAHLLACAIHHGDTVFDMLKMPFYHPVIEEALQAALYDLRTKVDERDELLSELNVL